MEKKANLQDILKHLEKQTEINNSFADIIKKMLNGEELPEQLNAELSKTTRLNIESFDKDPAFISFKPKEKYYNFLSMVATSLVQSTSEFSFKDQQNNSWGNLSHKTSFFVNTAVGNINEKTNILYQKNKISFKETAEKLKISYQEFKQKTKDTLQDTIDYFVLVGDKRKIKQLNKQFKANLSLLGFEAHDLVNQSSNQRLSPEDVKVKINEQLNKKMNIEEKDNNYQINILDGLNDTLKLEMIKKIVWPNVAKELSKTMQLSIYLSDLVNKDKEIKHLLSFSKKNNIHADIVIHSLKKNPEILQNYSSSVNLMEHKDSILKSSDKYDTLIQNNLVVFNSLIKATTAIKTILSNLHPELKAQNFISEIDNYEIAQRNGKENVTYIYSVVEKNISKIKHEKELVTPVVSNESTTAKPAMN